MRIACIALMLLLPAAALAADVHDGCELAGCSQELCVNAGERQATPCIWRPVYACYRQAVCEKQADGNCGWTQTDDLRACVQEKNSERLVPLRGEPAE